MSSLPKPWDQFLNWPMISAQIALIVLTTILYRRYFSPLSRIPGPFWASFSRLWHISRLLEGNQNTALIALHEKHGHFVRIAHNEVSVSHPDGIKKILLAPLHKGNWYSIIAFPDSRYQNPMSTTDPKKKIERSKNLASGYTISNLLQSEAAIDQNIRLLCGLLDKHSENQTPVNLEQYFAFITNDNVGEVVFSKSFGFLHEGKDIGNTIRNSFAHNAYVAIMGFYAWVHTLLIGNPFVTWLGIMPYGHIMDTALKSVKEREGNQDARFDLMSHWLRALNENPDRMNIRDVHSAAFNNIAAGADTVACGLQTFVYHMIRTPDVWQRAREELQSAGFGSSDEIVSFTDTQKLPYLQACITEALRIFAPVPMGLPRVVGADGLKIGNQSFPKGTIVSINPHVIHASKEIWGPTVKEFDPARWLSDEGAKMQKYWIPFGAGYASCPGQNIARIQLSKIAATLVRDYDIKQVDPNQDWQFRAYFTVVPYNWPVLVSKRDEA